jgi:hypothetical protein
MRTSLVQKHFDASSFEIHSMAHKLYRVEASSKTCKLASSWDVWPADLKLEAAYQIVEERIH